MKIHEVRSRERDRLRGKWLIVIMNKHYRGNCDILETILAVTSSSSSSSFAILLERVKLINSIRGVSIIKPPNANRERDIEERNIYIFFLILMCFLREKIIRYLYTIFY